MDVTIKIVLDTSVLVAAARSRNGASFALVTSLPDSRFQICLSVAVYTEWQAVLTRPEHLPPGADADAALGLIRYLTSLAHLQDIHFLWRPFLRDPDDDMLLECFQRLEGRTEPASENFRYVLALLLMRRKRFKFEETRNGGGREVLVLKCGRTGTRHEVANPHLTDEQMTAVQEDVFQALGWE